MSQYYTAKSTKDIIEKSDDIFELMKRIKGYRNRYLTKTQKVEEAEQEVSEMKLQLQAATKAIMEGADIESLSLADIQRKIKSAEGRREKAAERNKEDIDAAEAMVKSLIDSLMDIANIGDELEAEGDDRTDTQPLDESSADDSVFSQENATAYGETESDHVSESVQVVDATDQENPSLAQAQVGDEFQVAVEPQVNESEEGEPGGDQAQEEDSDPYSFENTNL